MIQLQILSGKRAGDEWAARHFPVRVGRGSRADLIIEEPGVWDDHLELDLKMPAGIVVRATAAALVLVNGESVQERPLKNGDLIEFGGVQARFWVSPTVQRSLQWREALTWATLALLFAVQIVLIYCLPG